MKKFEFKLIENYMLDCMKYMSHDKDHIYRVLFIAIDIASHEENVDTDVLIAACLLHDIGRSEQFSDEKENHAKVGAKKAYELLLSKGFSEEFAHKVKSCIKTHRFRSKKKPESLEAKILFDADKVDVTGAMGIARTLMYGAEIGSPIYGFDNDGELITDGSDFSFIGEYNVKLKNIYDVFYTKRAEELALERKKSAQDFYLAIACELKSTYANCRKLDSLLRD